jgi:hypothetical protein
MCKYCGLSLNDPLGRHEDGCPEVADNKLIKRRDTAAWQRGWDAAATGRQKLLNQRSLASFRLGVHMFKRSGNKPVKRKRSR